MNYYVDLMGNAVNYIEENLQENLTLAGVSRRFNLSEYHFDRLFNTVVGKSLKQYVLGRKLSLAVQKLNSTHDSVIDVAMSLGFQYPEVFSRAFKRQFGISPRSCRTKSSALKTLDKVEIVPRDVINYMGGVTLKATYSHLEPIRLAGVAVEVDISDSNYGGVLKTASDKYLAQSKDFSFLDHEQYYSAVACHGDEGSRYTVFSGKKMLGDAHNCDFEQFNLPGGWYAGFVYRGDMIEIRSTFEEDLFKWIAAQEIELSDNGVGMLSVYQKDYDITRSVDIYVPVKSPK